MLNMAHFKDDSSPNGTYIVSYDLIFYQKHVNLPANILSDDIAQHGITLHGSARMPYFWRNALNAFGF